MSDMSLPWPARQSSVGQQNWLPTKEIGSGNEGLKFPSTDKDSPGQPKPQPRSMIALTVIKEFLSIPDHPLYFEAVNGSAAIYWSGVESLHYSHLRKGAGYVSVDWGVTVFVGCYFFPNRGLDEYKAYLHGLRNNIRSCNPCPVFVLGTLKVQCAQYRDGGWRRKWLVSLTTSTLHRGS